MSLVAKFSSVGAATLASRVLGFVREAMIAAMLGNGPVADAFYAAFRFPNLFRRLFAEGAFNSAFVPLFAKELEGGGREAARRFAEQVLSVLLLILTTLTALAMIFMPFLVDTVIASSFEAGSDKFEATVLYARIMFPYLAAMSLVAMLSGVLNSFRRYFLAALAPVLLNIVLIAALAAGMFTAMPPADVGFWLSCSVVLSGLLQFSLLLYGMRREGFGLSLRFPTVTPPVRRLLWLALPAAVTGGITQINLLVGQNIASAQAGAISVINYADRINQLPLGVIGIAIGVVLLPELSRALKAGDLVDAAHLQNRSLEFGLGLTVPAAIGFALMPEALVALVFERGAFTRETTLITADVLRYFAMGLPAFTLISIFRPGFYAREDMKTPMWFAGANAATNIVGSLVLFPLLGVIGIAIATTLAGWVNALLLAAALWRRSLFRPSAVTLRRLALIALANVAMAALLIAAGRYLEAAMLEGALLVRVLVVLAVIVCAALVYFAIVIATGAVERDRLLALVRRRARS
ncbi:MAG: murein biosynthesis integral membrane protein MurJ [Pseudomonadota bacterium]|nr:murein biosynthesis integral membrane protein MurJ [Pseudomonadota bacterium]